MILVNPSGWLAASNNRIALEEFIEVGTHTSAIGRRVERWGLGFGLMLAGATLAEEAANPTTMSFAASGAIQMKLNKGDIEVVGTDSDTISVAWTSDTADDHRGVKVRLQRPAANEASVFLDGPGDRIRYHIEVPHRSDVAIHMRAGELQVRGVVGSMDVDLIAGQMDLRLGDPRRYGNVAASVTAGELEAKPWQIEKAGLWRSFKLSGEGGYELRARLIAGQLTIRAE